MTLPRAVLAACMVTLLLDNWHDPRPGKVLMVALLAIGLIVSSPDAWKDVENG